MYYDVIIVGAGHNGLAAGVILARAGRKVLILEAQPQPGGAVRTAEVTRPGFRHDLYATNLNAFVGSAFLREFDADLRRQGLAFARASKAFGSVFPDGDFIGITTSVEETREDLTRVSAHDAAAWTRLTKRFARIGPPLATLLQRPMPSAALLGLPFDALRLAMQSSRSFVEARFEHPKVRALWAAWGMHLDFPPETRGGALYPFLQCMQIQRNGLNLGTGGAGVMIDAMERLFCESGGELRCACPVTGIAVERGEAVAVVAAGERILAREAIIANVVPSVLFKLVGQRLSSGRYRHGPGTMMIHLALSDLPDWRDARAREFAYIHISPSLDAMTRAYGEALRGILPSEPVLVVAQPTVIDPSRAPPGGHVLSIQVRMVPATMNKEAYADAIIDLMDRYAPGLRRKILGRFVISPADLERENPNLVGGDSIGGSHHLRQQFVFRPFLGWSRYSTPIARLYVCGASTWPGAGVGAGSGWLLGHRLAKR